MQWQQAAFSLFPTHALRDWAARPFTAPFRTAFFCTIDGKN